MINAIIIDDAQNSIDALQIKLERHCPDIRVIQTCTKPTESIDAISFHKPDLIFLDVEMPAMNGFALLQQIPVINFEIIFVTAYNHYTLPAIRVNAFDYLEKPVNITLLKEAIERLKKKIQGRHSSSAGHDAVLHLLKSMQQSQRPAGLALSSADGIEMVNMNNITWIESVNNYTRFHLNDGKKILVSKTLGEYEERLSGYDFIRIHRSHMINLHYLHKYYREDCLVELKNGTRLEVAVRKKQELMDLLRKLG